MHHKGVDNGGGGGEGSLQLGILRTRRDVSWIDPFIQLGLEHCARQFNVGWGGVGGGIRKIITLLEGSQASPARPCNINGKKK
jgi:hypothetical protein